MIPILFDTNDKTFDTFGIGVLTEAKSCEVTEERNGIYELTLKYPIDGRFYSYIEKEKIIVAKPNDLAEQQAFRIYKISKPINGIITINANHISYDLATIGVVPFSLVNRSATQCGQDLLNNASIPHSFTFQTDISKSADFGSDIPKGIRNLLGGTKGSMLDLFGGEFEWDNFSVILHSSRGADRGVLIEYGKNLTKFTHESDITDTYTHILPYGTAEDKETGEKKVITLPEKVLPISETILHNGKVFIKDMTDEFNEYEEITEYALRTKTNIWIKNHPLGVESESITVSFEPLWKQKEYSSIHERLSLCDTVTIRHSILGITTKMKVIKTVYSTLDEKYKSVTLGEAKSNLAVRFNSIEEEIKNTQGKVDKFPSILSSAILKATQQITGNSGGCVVTRTKEDGTPYELLILDNEDITKAVNVWRWNIGGLGFSSNGYNGPYETAITQDGTIVANFITSGTLAANIIKAGVLSSLDGSSYWNLETGEVVLNAYANKEVVNDIASNVEIIEEKQSSIQESLNGLTSSVSSVSGRVGTLEQGVNELGENLTKVEFNVSTLQQTATQISADVSSKADKAYGDSNSSFGWKLDSESFELYSNKNTVMKASSKGLDVMGKVTSNEGTIGGFTINTNSISAGTPGSESGIELTSVSLIGYKSNNQGIHSSYSVSKITINKATNLTIYIRSNAESSFDYTIASIVNASCYPTSYLHENTFAHTRANQQSGASLSYYTKVEYYGLSEGDFIYIVFRKDASASSNTDTGYVLVPDTLDISLSFDDEEYYFVRDTSIDVKGASIKVGIDFSVDHTGAIKSTSGEIGNLKISNGGLSYDGAWDTQFQIGSLSSDPRLPTYAIFSRTQRIDNCIMGFKSTSYGENFWVEFKPEGYCAYMSSDAEDVSLIGKIPYNQMNMICWLNTALGSLHTGDRATCPQIIVLNATVPKSSYSTLDLDVYGINEIIGASLTEKDTSDTGSNNQWFSLDGTSITIHNTTTKEKVYSAIIIAV
mgnify:FL=1